MTTLLLIIIYISFISLGLPDSLLGAAWPSIYPQIDVPVSYAGILSMIIALGTVVSSLNSDRLTRKFGTGKVTAFSVALTAAALLGYSFSQSFWMLVLCSIPYGLGAGAVDASLNNYVALHYESHHMSWLHCMWGVGATVGPYLMGMVLTAGRGWNSGFLIVGLFQILLSAVLIASLPLWKHRDAESDASSSGPPLKLKEVFQIPGAVEIMLMFFCYCGYEQTAILWSGTYLVNTVGLTPEKAALLASLFCIGLTAGRAFNGFLTFRFSDNQLIRAGETVIALGAVLMLLPFGDSLRMAGLVLIGLGCAPIYPCVIHSTPANFGEENSQAVIGVEMASAYIGTLAVPPAFGLIARHISTSLFPVYILVFLALGAIMFERLLRSPGRKPRL